MYNFYLYRLFLFRSFSQNWRKFFKGVYGFNLNYMSNIAAIKKLKSYQNITSYFVWRYWVLLEEVKFKDYIMNKIF